MSALAVAAVAVHYSGQIGPSLQCQKGLSMAVVGVDFVAGSVDLC